MKKSLIFTLLLFTSLNSFAESSKSDASTDNCSVLVNACEAAGYTPADDEKGNGKGLQSDCMTPYLDGKMVKGLNTKSLARQKVASCRPQATSGQNPRGVTIENETKKGTSTTGPYVGPQTSGPGSMPIQTGPATSPNNISK